MTKAYYTFIAVFIGICLQLLCLLFIRSGEDNNPYYQVALGIISVITVILLFVLCVTKPDTIKSLLKSDYQMNLYELMLASWVSSIIDIKKLNISKEMVIERIKEEKIFLSEKFNILRTNFSKSCYINHEMLQDTNADSVIKKAISIHLNRPKGRYLTHYKLETCKDGGMQSLPFYTTGKSFCQIYYSAVSSVEVSQEYLDDEVEKKQLIRLPQPVYISNDQTVAINPDGKIFIVEVFPS